MTRNVKWTSSCSSTSTSEEPVVSFVQSRGRAASPLAAGNRDVHVDVMGGADASRPESGERCVRTFPATPFGMTDSGGQGLPALPTGSLPSPRSGFHAFVPGVFSSVRSRVGRRVPSPPALGTHPRASFLARMRCAPGQGGKGFHALRPHPFGIPLVGGQGLPALPTGSLPSPRSGFHAFQCLFSPFLPPRFPSPRSGFHAFQCLLSPFPVPPMNLQPTRSHP